jgi:hypothetical protein
MLGSEPCSFTLLLPVDIRLDEIKICFQAFHAGARFIDEHSQSATFRTRPRAILGSHDNPDPHGQDLRLGRHLAGPLPDLYIAHYTLDYIAPGFASRQAWLADRRERLVEPDYIRLRLVDFELVSLSEASATTRFTLIYERPGYSDETLKELVFSNRGGLWLISAENNLSVKVL